jgi:excisionase family DNA binding protein
MLTHGQAAARLSVDVSTLKRWRQQGKVPYKVTPGGHYRYNPADIDALFREFERYGGPQSKG